MTTTPDFTPADTLVDVPADAPEAYWEGWATQVGSFEEDGRQFKVLRTNRTGRDGTSDAQYIIDRLASGLHFGRLHN